MAHKEGFAKDRLVNFVQRLSKLDDEKEALSDDRREVLTEAKGEGFDTKTLNLEVKRFRMDKADRKEADAMQDLYDTALGFKE
jgi:uncharacterized protein (UPF0335 family)